MALSITFYDHIKYGRLDFIDRDADFIGNGVVALTDFPLVFPATPNLTVQVGAGRAWVDGYRIANDSTPVALTFQQGDPNYPRIDIIQIGHDDINSQASLVVKQGVPGSQPVEPGPDPGYIALYAVTVPAGATQITSANVADRRSLVPLQVSAAQINYAGAVANQGGLTSMQAGLDASKPAPGNAGRLYVATDTQIVYLDTGTAWEKIGVANWGDILGKPTGFTPTAHKSTHAAGGSDPLSPSDIGAASLSATNTFSAAQTAPQWVSTAPQGTPPLQVASSTMVAGLNADMVGGKRASDLALASDLFAHAANDTLHIPYAAATGAANAYAITLSPGPSAYTEGMAVAVKINTTNTGPSTLNVNGLGAIAIKMPNGGDVPSGKLVAGSIYTVRYNGTNFVLQGSDAAGNATPDTVLSGKTFSNDSGVGLTGTMPNNGAIVITPSTANQAIPAGYHNGSGYVVGDPDLIPGNIKSGVNIFGIVGTLQVHYAASGQIPVVGSLAPNSYTVSCGFRPTFVALVIPNSSSYLIAIVGTVNGYSWPDDYRFFTSWYSVGGTSTYGGAAINFVSDGFTFKGPTASGDFNCTWFAFA